MSTTRFATLIGLALGAVLALSQSWLWTLAAVFFTLVGFIVGLVLDGRVDTDALGITGNRRDRTRL